MSANSINLFFSTVKSCLLKTLFFYLIPIYKHKNKIDTLIIMRSFMKNIKNTIFSIFLLFILFNLDKLVLSSLNTVNFIIDTLIPSLFIMLVISNYILENNLIDFKTLKLKYLNKLFNTNSNAILLILFMILLGTPSSIILINTYVKQKRIDKDMAKRLLYCTCIISPSFIIGVCGINIFNSNDTGIFLWLIQVITCLILLIIFRKTKIIVTNNNSLNKYTIKKALLNSAVSILLISGYLIIFIAFFNLATYYIDPFIKSTLIYIFEFSLGCLNISTLNITFNLKLIYITIILAFSGICMHYQILSVISEFKVNYFKYIIFKIIQCLIATILIFSVLKLSHLLL